MDTAKIIALAEEAKTLIYYRQLWELTLSRMASHSTVVRLSVEGYSSPGFHPPLSSTPGATYTLALLVKEEIAFIDKQLAEIEARA